MSDFKTQMMEDFEDYRDHNPGLKNIDKDEWAFNYWVLDKFFSVDENIIEDYIVDYNDKGIDCFVWHEDLKDLYLIQNKFYSEETRLTKNYIQNDFLTRAIGALEKGTYDRSQTLQDIYNRFSEEEEFSIHFHLYVTNDSCKTDSIVDSLADFNEKYAKNKYDVKMFSLNEIQELYYSEPTIDKKTFTFTLSTINRGTILNVDNSAYQMTLALDAKYILTPVYVVYKMMKTAENSSYPIFDENIREYLGSTGAVNKKIMTTLKNPSDRNNFFFYNNGITMIVEDFSSERTEKSKRKFEVTNPQIVNGCQTVSTIYETLSSLPISRLEEEFANTYVMIKILKISSKDEQLKKLYKDIVKYNNSQNSINEKTFNAVKDVFKHVQFDFENRGLLVQIKQSDKHKFTKVKYKTPTKLLNKNKKELEKFGLNGFEKTKDFLIELEKFLQIVLAFVSNPQDAVQNKSLLLKENSSQQQKVIEFIKSAEGTSNDLFYLTLLYLRAEQEKKNSVDKKTPNPFYLIYFFARYDCAYNKGSISAKLKDKESIGLIVEKYQLIFAQYYKEWKNNNPDKEYNDMIKSAIDLKILDSSKETVDSFLELQKKMKGAE